MDFSNIGWSIKEDPGLMIGTEEKEGVRGRESR